MKTSKEKASNRMKNWSCSPTLGVERKKRNVQNYLRTLHYYFVFNSEKNVFIRFFLNISNFYNSSYGLKTTYLTTTCNKFTKQSSINIIYTKNINYLQVVRDDQ